MFEVARVAKHERETPPHYSSGSSSARDLGTNDFIGTNCFTLHTCTTQKPTVPTSQPADQPTIVLEATLLPLHFSKGFILDQEASKPRTRSQGARDPGSLGSDGSGLLGKVWLSIRGKSWPDAFYNNNAKCVFSSLSCSSSSTSVCSDLDIPL